MKQANYYLLIALSICSLLSEHSYCQQKSVIPTSYEIVMKLNAAFNEWQTKNKPRLRFPSFLAIPVETFDTINKETDGTNYVAITGTDGTRLTVGFAGTSSVITRLQENVPTDFERTVSFNEALRRNYSRLGLPPELEDFPLAIKMPKDNIDRVIGETGCKYLLLFPGLENNRITLSILGSEPDSPTPHILHVTDVVRAEETWPDEDVTFLIKKQPETDIVMPSRSLQKASATSTKPIQNNPKKKK